MKKKIILITGVAGFIGFHLAKKLIDKNFEIIGIDNLNNYYDVKLKKERLDLIKKDIIFHKVDLVEYLKLQKIFKKYKPNYVVNLAAQAGVRYSLRKPKEYISSNVVGFFNILELSKKFKVKHLLFASSSSVYGLNKNYPFSENQSTSKPANIYAATKKTNELLAHSYSYLFNLKCTGLRYFTVYGPFGRPDMSIFKFVKNILNGKQIDVFNNGNMSRDFTYIDDAINYTYLILKKSTQENKLKIPFQIFNISNGRPTKLKAFIKLIEANLKAKAKINYINNLKTEIKITHGNSKKIIKAVGKVKHTPVKEGVKKFIEWFKFFNKY